MIRFKYASRLETDGKSEANTYRTLEPLQQRTYKIDRYRKNSLCHNVLWDAQAMLEMNIFLILSIDPCPCNYSKDLGDARSDNVRIALLKSFD